MITNWIVALGVERSEHIGRLFVCICLNCHSTIWCATSGNQRKKETKKEKSYVHYSLRECRVWQ